MTVIAFPVATDAGHLCPRCHRPVTWTDHLPPVKRGMSVRCYAGELPKTTTDPAPLLHGVREGAGPEEASLRVVRDD